MNSERTAVVSRPSKRVSPGSFSIDVLSSGCSCSFCQLVKRGVYSLTIFVD